MDNIDHLPRSVHQLEVASATHELRVRSEDVLVLHREEAAHGDAPAMESRHLHEPDDWLLLVTARSCDEVRLQQRWRRRSEGSEDHIASTHKPPCDLLEVAHHATPKIHAPRRGITTWRIDDPWAPLHA